MLDLGVDWLPRDVRPEMRVVVAPGGGRLAADAAGVRLVPRVHLEVVGEVVAAREALVAVRAGVVPGGDSIENNFGLSFDLKNSLKLHSAKRSSKKWIVEIVPESKWNLSVLF